MSHLKMQSPKFILGAGLLVGTGAVRLPPGEFIQVVHFDTGTIEYLYGSVPSGALYPPTIGVGPILLHPGTEVFVRLLQVSLTNAFIHVRGGIPEESNG